MSVISERPTTGFDDFGLGRDIHRGIAAAGFTVPRPIQSQTIPEALEGRDILGLAQTGTGKTAAFALPVLERLLATRGSGPRVLVLAPTRELASQIAAEIGTLSQFTPIKSVTIFGGVSARPQIAALRNKPEIIVACPGRLLDLMQQGAVHLDRIETLILDEADHMFDMGFLPDIRRIMAALPERRQNLLFSATMPTEIRRLAKSILTHPHIVEIDHTRPLTTIEHALYPVADGDKLGLLQHLLSENNFVSAIVFTRTKHRARRLALQLDKAGHRAVALQGNMSQNARDRTMSGFRTHQFNVLVATDIAARGIDVERISHVINFDMPNTADAYTHRIGRTGRSEREGKAYTFVTADDHAMVRDVERRIGASIPRRTIDAIPSIPFNSDRPASRRPVPSAKKRSPARGRAGGGGSGPKARQGTASATTAGNGARRRRPRRAPRTAAGRSS